MFANSLQTKKHLQILPRKCLIIRWALLDSNQRPPACKAWEIAVLIYLTY